MDAVNVSAKFAVRTFTRSWDNSDCSFELGFWREGEAVGVRDGTIRKGIDEFP